MLGVAAVAVEMSLSTAKDLRRVALQQEKPRELFVIKVCREKYLMRSMASQTLTEIV